MRNAFFAALAELFRENGDAFFLTGDLGYKLFRPLVEIDPRRVINAGIREAAMVGLAGGLAKEGLLPFVYSITPFATLRCLEQIKLDLCYPGHRAVVVGVGGGYSYGENGPTHHGIEDLGLMRLLPGMTVLSPAGPDEVRACVRAAADLKGPAYIRLGRTGEPDAHPPGSAFDLFAAEMLRDGTDLVLVATGHVLPRVVEAARRLEARAVSARVVRVSCLKPLDEEGIARLALPGKPLLVVEEHVAGQALAQPVAELLLRRGIGVRFKTVAAPDRLPETCMSREKLVEWAGLDVASIADACRALLEPDARA